MASKRVTNKRGGAWDPEQLQGKQLASLLDVTPPTVTQWHRDRGCPRNPDGSYALAEVFGWLRGNQLDLDHVRQVDILRIVGVSKPSLRDWEARGCPRNDDGKTYSIGAVVRWRLEELEGRVAEAKASSELDAARLRKLQADAEIAGITAAERRGDVVRRDAVVAGLVSRVHTLKQSHLALLGQLEAEGVDPATVKSVREKIEKLLVRFAGGRVDLHLDPNQSALLEQLLSSMVGTLPDTEETP